MIFQGLEELRAARVLHQRERHDAFLEVVELVRHWGSGVALTPEQRLTYVGIANRIEAAARGLDTSVTDVRQ